LLIAQISDNAYTQNKHSPFSKVTLSYGKDDFTEVNLVRSENNFVGS